MKVRFQVSNHVYNLEKERFYKIGDIVNIPDLTAKIYIEGRIVKPFDYSITDEEIKQLHKKLNNTKEFERKVEVYIEVLSKSNVNVQLADGKRLLFEVTPKNPNEWYYFNKHLSEFYIKEFYKCSLEGLIDDFTRKLKNFPYFEILKKSELNRINKVFQEGTSSGIYNWYEKTKSGEIPKDEIGIANLLSRKVLYGIEDFLQGKSIAEYEGFLKTFSQKSIKDKDIKVNVKFMLNGIDIPKLVNELGRQNYFDTIYKENVLNWFNGIIPGNPIPINVSANLFISLIGELSDKKYIKNSKKFCYTYIENSFLFKGEKVKNKYIEKVMKPNSENRVSSAGKTIPDIQEFKTST